MRRNLRGGLGGQVWQNNPRPSGGPLMTDHLGLQDIDKELELLQRKREIIEQQQQILSNEFRRNDYQEPYRASHSQNLGYDDYTQSYSDARDYVPPSRKRPIQVWEDNVPNKRFSGQIRSKPRPFLRQSASSIPSLMSSGPTYGGGYQGSQPRQVRPLFRPKQPKRDIPPKKDFNPPRRDANAPKVAKSTAAPNKSNAHSVSDRKVPEGGKSTFSAMDSNNMLRPDREPSKHITGRLELALGSIIKEIKAADPNALKMTAVMRDVKSAVRERIRDLMMNQVVGPAETVRARYREVYDAQSDAEIVTNALDAQTDEVTLLKIDDPEKYFKLNMHKIMQLKLKSLLDKLDKISMEECENYKKSGIAPDIKVPETPETIENDKFQLDEEIASTVKYMGLEKWMSSRITGLIKKFIPYFMKLMDIDYKYSKLKNMITSETVKMLMQKNGQDIEEQNDVTMRSINESLDSPRVSTPKSPYKPLPYFAKLMGKPSLPKRNQMERFFAEFGPKSIKKHRAVHNLLFVGFADKESFDRFLAADGTVMGRYTLSVRVSERSSIRPEQEQTELNASSDDKSLDSELENQITDLLSCIRNTTEDGEGSAETDCKEVADNNIAADENDTTTPNAGENKATDGDVDEDNNAENDETYFEENADTNTAENAGIVTEDNADTNNVAETDTAETNNLSDQPGNGDVDINKQTEIKQENEVIAEESTDTVQPLDNKAPQGKPTPARVSARLAGTPGRIQTRRASRMANNDA